MTKNKLAALKADLAASKGRDQSKIARKYKVSRSTVSDIYTERLHKDVPWPEGFEPVPLQGKGQRKKLPDHDPTDKRVMDLESEVIHLAEELKVERAKVKAGAKTQGLIRSVAKLLDGPIVSLPPLPSMWKPAGKRKVIEEHVVMHMSDGHHDQIVDPEECGGLERYNFPISCARAERYVNTVLKWTQQTLVGFKFPVLNVLAYGDHTSGEIHGAVTRSAFQRQMKNCLAIGKLHAMMYRDLAPFFEQINVVYVPGNHGRRTPKKDHHGAHDNWDYLIGKIAELHCQDHENVSFLIPDAFSVNLDINGVGFNVAHGDDIKGHMGIPYYGLQRRQQNMLAVSHMQSGPRVRYFCVGHFHKPGTMGDRDGEQIVNGPWLATDAYCFNSFAGYTEPSQWLHGVNPTKGITWRMNVLLRRQHEVPDRYKVEI